MNGAGALAAAGAGGAGAAGSAGGTTVMSISAASSATEAESLLETSSFAGDETVAVRTKVPARASLVVSATLALAPLASVPTLQTTSGALYAHEPWLGTAPTYSTPAGSGIVKSTLGVASGPLFLTVNEAVA